MGVDDNRFLKIHMIRRAKVAFKNIIQNIIVSDVLVDSCLF